MATTMQEEIKMKESIYDIVECGCGNLIFVLKSQIQLACYDKKANTPDEDKGILVICKSCNRVHKLSICTENGIPTKKVEELAGIRNFIDAFPLPKAMFVGDTYSRREQSPIISVTRPEVEKLKAIYENGYVSLDTFKASIKRYGIVEL